jgi:flagella basal body P-ring formation protein FlgA
MFKRFEKAERESITILSLFLFFLQVIPVKVSAEVVCTFFDSAKVNDTIIRLGDIAACSGAPEGISLEELKRTYIGEAAPAGYSRFMNADDVIRHYLHLAKIKCVSKENSLKRISVKTDFQEISLSSYEPDIEKYIKSKVGWPEGDYQLKINNKTQKMKCLKQPFSTDIEGLSSKYPKGNFNCKFIVHQGFKSFEVPISCCISIITPVVVSSCKIGRGILLSAENCHIEKMDITHFNYMPYITLHDLDNKLISRSVNSGAIIHEKLALSIPLVERDQMVRLVVVKGKIMACIDARARESGIMGNTILVENEMTHKLLKAKVVKKGQVVLLSGDGDI